MGACVHACLKIHSLLSALCVKMFRGATKVWQFCGQNGMCAGTGEEGRRVNEAGARIQTQSSRPLALSYRSV